MFFFVFFVCNSIFFLVRFSTCEMLKKYKHSTLSIWKSIRRWRTGVYGDVQRVKILYNKKDSALIQMAEQHQAYLGE